MSPSDNRLINRMVEEYFGDELSLTSQHEVMAFRAGAELMLKQVTRWMKMIHAAEACKRPYVADDSLEWWETRLGAILDLRDALLEEAKLYWFKSYVFYPPHDLEDEDA